MQWLRIVPTRYIPAPVLIDNASSFKVVDPFTPPPEGAHFAPYQLLALLNLEANELNRKLTMDTWQVLKLDT